MKNWQKFEKSCAEYLQKKFGEVATFRQKGGSDSTKSDILVTTRNFKSFYIDAKKSPAQCGQFVLLPNKAEKKFVYSPKNKSKENEHSKAIKNFMNENYCEFEKTDIYGKSLDKMPHAEKIFSNWIVSHYKNLGCKFVITNGPVILRVEDFARFFNVSAKYRIKRSGSKPIFENYVWQSVKKFLIESGKFSDEDFIDEKRAVKKKPFFAKRKILIKKNEFFFSPKDYGLEIRRLSNTFNANVIFSAWLKPNAKVRGLSDKEFVQELTR